MNTRAFVRLALFLSTSSIGISQDYYTNEPWVYMHISPESAAITGYRGTNSAVQIPSTIGGYQVKQVGGFYDAMQGFLSIFHPLNRPVSNLQYSVRNITIPEGVTTIEERAFYQSQLTSVTIPESVVTIGNEAFYYSSSLSNVTIASGLNLRAIGQRAFEFCPLAEPVTVSISTSLSTDSFPRGFAVTREIDSLATALASKIVAALPNNYGIATKSDLGTAVSNAISQTVSQVQANPNDYSLYSADQHAANYSNGVTAGTSLVTANPASYNLYTSNSIMDLRMGGLMIQKQGTNAKVVFQPQTTTDLATLPFTNNGAPITNTVPMPGNRGFLRINAVPPINGGNEDTW